MQRERNWRALARPIGQVVGGLTLCVSAYGSQVDIVGPSGSVAFGAGVVSLSNGNFVVIDSQGVGAAHLYTKAGALISTLRGSTVGDFTSAQVFRLNNSNFLLATPYWDNGSAQDAGAVTWVDGNTGLTDVVSEAVSLVGSTAGDNVGIEVHTLKNGNYVVLSAYWHGIVNGQPLPDVGAVTWAPGNKATSGTVSSRNSLVGSSKGDGGVTETVTELSNGNVVVANPNWDGDKTADVGAVTWIDGSSGLSGPISTSNSLVGTSADDAVGNQITALPDGNYVVSSLFWHNRGNASAGAATWCSGLGPTSDVVSETNSLVGSNVGDVVGGIVAPLQNGNYLVLSPHWMNPTAGASLAGAVTWAQGGAPFAGTVSESNSLVGTTANDQVGALFTKLTNGSVVIGSPTWHNGQAAVGAATWTDGSAPILGTISQSNSMIGNNAGDQFGANIVALTNGNYVVACPNCDLAGNTDVGAVAWGNGASGSYGKVSVSNSLHGGSAGDHVGSQILPLVNGNYVIQSPDWDRPVVHLVDVGASTLVDGTTGKSLIGNGLYVDIVNSLVGASSNDKVGTGILGLPNGDYVVLSPHWNNTATGASSAGAVTKIKGSQGLATSVDQLNSLVGAAQDDQVGYTAIALVNGNYVIGSKYWQSTGIAGAGAATWNGGSIGHVGGISTSNSLLSPITGNHVGDRLYALPNGDYVVQSKDWDNCSGPAPCIVDAGAITIGDGRVGLSGLISSTNSVLGTAPGGGGMMVWDYSHRTGQLIVGQPDSNIVSIFGEDGSIFADGFGN